MKRVSLRKIRAVTDQSHSANFRLKGMKLNQHGLQVDEFRLIQFQTSGENWPSDFDPLWLIYDATNIETRVNFGRP